MSENKEISPEEIAHILAKGANWGLRCEKVKLMVNRFFAVNSWAPMKTPEVAQAILEYYGADPLLKRALADTMRSMARNNEFPDLARKGQKVVRMYGKNIRPYIWGTNLNTPDMPASAEVDKPTDLDQLEARIENLETQLADLRLFLNY